MESERGRERGAFTGMWHKRVNTHKHTFNPIRYSPYTNTHTHTPMAHIQINM